MTTRYKDSPTKSAEYLRLVIPLLSKHKAAPNPFNYALWYEYVSNSNAELNQELDAVLDKGEALTDEILEAFYVKYIAEYDEKKFNLVNSKFQRLLDSLSDSTARTSDQAVSFSECLGEYGNQLQAKPEADSVSNIIEGLTSNTERMQDSISALNNKLDESRSEASELRSELDRIRTEAITDPLTGLVNRKGLKTAFEKALGGVKTDQDNVCLLIIDIDRFKVLNDTYGHLLGDKVIKFIADLIRQRVKGKDTAARFGGEEYVVLLPDTPISGARTVAEDIREAIGKSKIQRQTDKKPIGKVTASIGVARFRIGESIDDFINRADAALYESKNNGRNLVTVEKTE